MVSLNDIDAQLASLERSDEEDSFSDSSSSSSVALVTRKPVRETPKRALEDETAAAVLKKKRRKGHSTICWNYLKGTCRFSDDCMFRHVSPAKLDPADKLEMLRELKVKTFDAELGKVIMNLNIPTCKAYSKAHACKYETKCHFWHIDSATVARWAGFEFWCQPCRKAFNSDSQFREHNKGKVHLQNAAD